MSKLSKIIFLGSGTSTGVPVISCSCDVCKSTNPKNKRTRSSIYVESPKTHLLIDAGPDLRQQALRENLTRVDAVLYTHGHADHTTGFDEIRAFCWRREERLPLYGSPDTMEILTRMFPWGFDENYTGRGYVRAKPMPLEDEIQFPDLTVNPYEVIHASLQTHGFFITFPSGKKIAYSSDIKGASEKTKAIMKKANILVIDGLRIEPHPSHFHLSEAIDFAQEIGASKTYLTHMSHEIDYDAVSAELPEGILLAYDGLTLEL